jgi:hypothetical protein
MFLYLFSRSKFKKRIRLIDDMRRPIAGGGVHLASKTDHFQAYFQRLSRIKAIESSRLMERAMGIEPTSEAWEALDKTLKAIDLAALCFPSDDLNWKLGGN